MREVVNKIKLRLGILYDDPLKDKELEFMAEAAKQDLLLAGVSDESINSDLGISTIILHIKMQDSGMSNFWTLYISNIVKLRGDNTG